MRAWRLGIFVLSVAAVLAVLLLRDNNAPGEPIGDPMLPDLWASAPFELTPDVLEGRNILRFTTEINNRGTGDLIVRGNPETGNISQWISHSESGHAVEKIDVEVVWGGDTHDHWHLDAMARYWIEPVDGSAIGDRFDNKVGFCMFDSVDRLSGLPGAPEAVRYGIDGCGGRLVPDVAMGLSVGWGDQYRFNLDGQWIDIEGLEQGRYRLVAEVDPNRLIIESDRSNNEAVTDFLLTITDSGERIVLQL